MKAIYEPCILTNKEQHIELQRCQAIRARRYGTKQGPRVHVGEVETVMRGAREYGRLEKAFHHPTATLGGGVKTGFAGIISKRV